MSAVLISTSQVQRTIFRDAIRLVHVNGCGPHDWCGAHSLTVWVEELIQINVKCWRPVGVISMQGHHQQGGPRATQLVMPRLQPTQAHMRRSISTPT
jgi:hypothetical protein